ncbi:MAG: thioredoxin [Clostridia bacterium]|nr:thioredoxin [Clostridia bacterium]
MKVIKVTEKTFENEVLNSEKTVVADFNADWCGPCRMLAPIVEELASENENVKFVSVNIDEEFELASQFNISSIPCVIIFKNGKEAKRSIGFKPKAAFEEMIKNV